MLLNQKGWRKLLQANGWKKTQGGKHNIKMEKPGKRPITLPKHHNQVYSKGLNAAIRKQAELD